MNIQKKLLFCGLAGGLLLFTACGTQVQPSLTGYGALSPGQSAIPVPIMRTVIAPDYNTESYAHRQGNAFKDPRQTPLSTFSIDVDTASYSNVRRMLRDNQQPAAGAVRLEELINYFSYDYPTPQADVPVAIYHELSECPWAPGHQLLQIGLQAKKIDMQDAPQANLVFLLDVSGSMYENLALVKKSLHMLVGQMRPQDKISIVVYAGASGVVLPPTSGKERQKIDAALDQLEAGGATAGSEGIKLAYKLAEENLLAAGNNRIILATDGDFNLGLTSESALVRLIEAERTKGISLTVLGFGVGNYNDVTAESLADHGNGNYAYIDSLLEAKKVLVKEMGATLLTVAKDVKLQVEFNPAQVKSYRLIGYENRLLNPEDFANDKKDAGEMGAGHTVTALYEIIPHDGDMAGEDQLRYQQHATTTDAAKKGELALVKYRYKEPGGDTSKMLSFTVPAQANEFSAASENQRFAAAVAAWGMLLTDPKYKGQADWGWIINTARGAKGVDPNGDRAEFIKLVELSNILAGKKEQ